MNFLLCVEHSAENLQFILWLRDYEERWQVLPQIEKNLSPSVDPNTVPQQAARFAKMPNSPGQSLARDVLARTDFGKPVSHKNLLPSSLASAVSPHNPDEANNVFDTPPRTPKSRSSTTALTASSGTIETSPDPCSNSWAWSVSGTSSPIINYANIASDAFSSVDVKWQPCG